MFIRAQNLPFCLLTRQQCPGKLTVPCFLQLCFLVVAGDVPWMPQRQDITFESKAAEMSQLPRNIPPLLFPTCILHPNVFRKVLHRRGELITPDPGLINKLWRQMADFPLMLTCLDHKGGAGGDCRDFLPSDDWECNGSSLAGPFTQVHQHSMCKTYT